MKKFSLMFLAWLVLELALERFRVAKLRELPQCEGLCNGLA